VSPNRDVRRCSNCFAELVAGRRWPRSGLAAGSEGKFAKNGYRNPAMLKTERDQLFAAKRDNTIAEMARLAEFEQRESASRSSKATAGNMCRALRAESRPSGAHIYALWPMFTDQPEPMVKAI
jgi:hypothetical protein